MPKSKEIFNIKDLFNETSKSKKQCDEAIRIIENVVTLENVGVEMKKKVIDCMLWNITGRAEGTEGKYLTRYRSLKALNDPEAILIHEHVYKRSNLIKEIIDNKGVTLKVKEKIIGCVVTEEEHKRLHNIEKGLDGWARYEAAQIKVMDMLKGEELEY